MHVANGHKSHVKRYFYYLYRIPPCIQCICAPYERLQCVGGRGNRWHNNVFTHVSRTIAKKKRENRLGTGDKKFWTWKKEKRWTWNIRWEFALALIFILKTFFISFFFRRASFDSPGLAYVGLLHICRMSLLALFSNDDVCCVMFFFLSSLLLDNIFFLLVRCAVNPNIGTGRKKSWEEKSLRIASAFSNLTTQTHWQQRALFEIFEFYLLSFESLPLSAQQYRRATRRKKKKALSVSSTLLCLCVLIRCSFGKC